MAEVAVVAEEASQATIKAELEQEADAEDIQLIDLEVSKKKKKKKAKKAKTVDAANQEQQLAASDAGKCNQLQIWLILKCRVHQAFLT